MTETFAFETLIHLIRHQVTPYYAKNSKINFTFFTKFLYHKTLCIFTMLSMINEKNYENEAKKIEN